MRSKEPKLTIFTASAGSGKTYTLTQEFLALALAQDPDYFRRVLAITFTRDATKEMKGRIVKELSRLAHGNASPRYLAELEEKSGIAQEFITERATKVLTTLLGDYSAFRVRTIDSFFEEIVRSFASEIGFSTRYKVELDNKTRLHQATLLLLSSLAQPEYNASLTRVREIMAENLKEGKRNDVAKVMERLGLKLFAEGSIDNKDRGSLPDTRTITATKKAFEAYKEAVTEEGNGKRLSDPQKKIFLASIKLIEENLSLLGTLADLENAMFDFGRENNSMLLHSSQTFIQKIIKTTEIPFIYERVGTQLNHFLIDEFQDTSRLQFQNLRPLLADSLAQGRRNLVVGDTKQSIYLFRHCDRTILSDLVYKEFGSCCEKQNLGYNWRSAPEIVTFNNELFGRLPKLVAKKVENVIEEKLKVHRKSATLAPEALERLESLHQEITENYEEVQQEVPHEKQSFHGGVEVCRYAPEDSPLKSLPEVILNFITQKGYNPGDIAILCFKNSEVAEVATTLMAYGEKHPEVSSLLRFTGSEALRLTNSDFVTFVIELFRSLNRPEAKSCKELARFRYERLQAKAPEDELNHPHAEVLPFEALFEQMQRDFEHLNLYDLTERALQLCLPMMTRQETPYLIMLLELVSSFGREETADLYSFLHWWDEKGSKTDLPAENLSNAIHLLTLHKAKGLEFPLVLLPFPSWNLGFSSRGISELLRVKLPEQFKNTVKTSMGAAYIGRTVKVADSVFAEDYFRELVAEIIDRLNLFYVAMTRAEIGLVLWLKEPKDPEKDEKKRTSQFSFPLESLLDQVLREMDFEKNQHKMPIPPKNVEKEKRKASDYTFPSVEHLFNRQPPQVRIRLTGQVHFERNEHLRYGSAMHEVMSKITTLEDLPGAIHAVIEAGKIAHKEALQVEPLIKKVIQDPQIAPWYSPEAEVYNEQTILSAKKIHYNRPDRVVQLPDGKIVVVDYKFGKKEPRYKHQVGCYCELMKEMGFHRIKGYLLYLCETNYDLEQVYPSEG